MSWTDHIGELQESKATVLVRDCTGALEAAEVAEAGTMSASEAACEALRIQASVSTAVSQLVVTETLALMLRLDATCGERKGIQDSTPLVVSLSGDEGPAHKSLFSCVIVTKVGGWSAGEEAAWQVIEKGNHQGPSAPATTQVTGRNPPFFPLGIATSDPVPIMHTPSVSWIVTCLDGVAKYPLNPGLMGLPSGSFLVLKRPISSIVSSAISTTSSLKLEAVSTGHTQSSPSTLQIVSVPQCSDHYENGSHSMIDQAMCLELRMLPVASCLGGHQQDVEEHSPEHMHSHNGEVFRNGKLMQESTSASSAEKYVAQRLLHLSQLSTALHSLGRQRQVGIGGLEDGLSHMSTTERGDGALFMPIHCHAAVVLLRLCLACESAVEGRTNW
jgi:hypothetical protein